MSKTRELSPMELYPEHFRVIEDFDDQEIAVMLLYDEHFCGGDFPSLDLAAGTILRGYGDVTVDGTLNLIDMNYGSITIEWSRVARVSQEELDAICEMEHKRRERERQIASGQLELL